MPRCRTKVRLALQQRARLAALGTAVSKINHDLRGILATARLITDRLAESDNPEVRKAAPALLRSLDRAVDLCSDTLNFTREGPPKPEFETFPLNDLIDEVGEGLAKLIGPDRNLVECAVCMPSWSGPIAASFIG